MPCSQGDRSPPDVSGRKGALKLRILAFWERWADCLPMILERPASTVAHQLMAELEGRPGTPILHAVVACVRSLTGMGFTPPSWHALAAGARPQPRDHERMSVRPGWQHGAPLRFEDLSREDLFARVGRGCEGSRPTPRWPRHWSRSLHVVHVPNHEIGTPSVPNCSLASSPLVSSSHCADLRHYVATCLQQKVKSGRVVVINLLIWETCAGKGAVKAWTGSALARQASFGCDVYEHNNKCRALEVTGRDWKSEVVALSLSRVLGPHYGGPALPRNERCVLGWFHNDHRIRNVHFRSKRNGRLGGQTVTTNKSFVFLRVVVRDDAERRNVDNMPLEACLFFYFVSLFSLFVFESCTNFQLQTALKGTRVFSAMTPRVETDSIRISVALFKEPTQLSCVSQDSHPRKSILTRETNWDQITTSN